MRPVKISVVVLLAVLVVMLALAGAAGASPCGAQTYRVLVGAENASQGIDVMAYFPDCVRIHVGDTVHWVQNANEIHTVTFLGGTTAPAFVVTAQSLGLPSTPSPLVFNPAAVNQVTPAGGLGDTTTFVNSGLMGREAGELGSFSLRFTTAGTYHYLCLVHGAMMSGSVHVVPAGTWVPSPRMAFAMGQCQIAAKMAQVPAVVRAAWREYQPSTLNPDGTRTHYVALGFGQGQIDLMRFIPRTVRVKPGDTVVWQMRTSSDAPHTITFLNGQPEPGLFIPVPQQGAPPVLYIDPGTLFPAQPAPLLGTGLYSSGLLNPVPGTSYSLTVGAVAPGPLPYLCLLHDTSGMLGQLLVTSK
jgi:plastocyanin